MSIRVMTAVWQHSQARSGDLLVQLAIADFSNDEGYAFPSIPTLGTKARLSPRQVKRALDRLQRLGELTVFKKQGPHGVNRYRIILSDKLSPAHPAKVTSRVRSGDILGKKGGDAHVTQSVRRGTVKNLGEEVATQNGKLRPISETVLEVMRRTQKAGFVR